MFYGEKSNKIPRLWTGKEFIEHRKLSIRSLLNPFTFSHIGVTEAHNTSRKAQSYTHKPSLQTREHTSAVGIFFFPFSTFTALYNDRNDSGRHACSHVTQVCAHSKARLANGIKLWIIHTAARN